MKSIAGKLRSWPEGFALDEPMRAHALRCGVDAESEFEAFKDYHEAQGSRFVSWPAAFRTWCRNAAKWKAEKSQMLGGSDPHNNCGYDMRVAHAIGFTVPKRQPEAVIQALKDNEEAARETAQMSVEQRQVALRKLNEIRMGLKKDGKW